MTTAARLSLFLVYLTFPFYLFPSGGAQLSTGFVLVLLLFLIVSGPSNIVVTRQMIAHLMFVIYAITVNIIWYLQTDFPNFLNHVLFTAFAGLTFFCVAALARDFNAKTIHLLLVVIMVSITGQLLIVMAGLGRESFRVVAFFNNPNQLSYFAALCAGTAVIVGHLYRVQSPLIPLIVLASVPVSAMSLSRGGTLACLMYLLMVIFFSKALSFTARVMMIAVLVIAGSFALERFTTSETFQNFGSRVEQEDLEREATGNRRGYDRLFNYPENIVWGAGEGYYERFDEEIEFHSWPGTVLFCYGLIGTALMLRFLWLVIPDFRTLFYLSPLFLYNLTHHGGRSLILWCLLGLIAAVAAQKSSGRSLSMGSGVKNGSRRRRRKRTMVST